MKDARIEKLANILVNYSTKIQKGEKVLIDGIGQCDELVCAIIKEVYAAGGWPFVRRIEKKFDRQLIMSITKEHAQLMAKHDCALMNDMDAYIGVRSGENAFELSDVPSEQMQIYSTYYANPVMEIRVPHTKWVVLRYPSPSMAQLAKESTEAFEDFYFDVCNLDYSKMSVAMDSLVKLMDNTDKVRIVGPNDTDITFSIKGIPSIKCDGQLNIPDGEVYSAPVKDSVNGIIHYNTPSTYNGFSFTDVRLEFKDGKIINATSNDNARINKIFETDEGAKYVGEFAIGVHPHITKAIDDILFDEKIAGSIHFTPGSSYDDAFNGNKSAIHWDLVLIQSEEFGGGEIYFDDVLIRKNGLFVVDELKCLNPENLI